MSVVELGVDRRAPARREHSSATTSITAPTEEPALRIASRYSSQKPERFAASGEKNGLLSTSAQSQLSRLILCSPIWTSAARTVTPFTTLPRQPTGGNAHGGFPSRRAAAAAIVAHAILQIIGVIGVAWPVAPWRSRNSPSSAGRCSRSASKPGCRWSFEPVRHHPRCITPERILDLVRLAPLGDKARLARLALVHPVLQPGSR
jgi:hypothetical protein